MKLSRFAFRRASREWNRLAVPTRKIVDISDFADWCRTRHGETGSRHIELPSYWARDGRAHIIDF